MIGGEASARLGSLRREIARIEGRDLGDSVSLGFAPPARPGSPLRKGAPAEMDPALYRRVRMCLMLELTCIVGILVCAPMMARGLGYFGR